MTLHVGILAGEPSGDLLGAGAMRALAARAGAVRFTGVGGDAMLAAGLQPVLPMAELTVHGFADPIKRLPQLLGHLRRLHRGWLQDRPDVFLGVDFNVFNGLLERRLKRAGIATCHYVSPSVYAWRRGRAQRMAAKVDALLTLFPFEPPFYAGTGVEAVCVGHPMADAIAVDRDSDAARASARQRLALAADAPVLALLPGSRRSELGFMLEPFLATARLLAAGPLPGLHCVLPVPTQALADLVQPAAAAAGVPVQVLVDGAADALDACSVALVKSGTATLETMLRRRPMVVAYRLGDATYWLLQRLLYTRFFALPNILADSALVPELLQDAVQPELLASALASAFAQRQGPAEAALMARFEVLHRDLARDADARAADVLLRLAGAG